MLPSELFAVANALALPGWAILILAPRRWSFLNAIPALVIPALLSALYSVLILTHMSATEGGFGDLESVRRLFSDDHVLVAGWVHYLAFDMLIGAHAARMMDRAAVGRVVQAPILLATFMLGPIGWLLARATQAGLCPVRGRAPFAMVRKVEG